ncbi:MAG TPA: hypothetical protein VF548_00440 [Allosphingosinicella sp.]|jgi:hypothetical protein
MGEGQPADLPAYTAAEVKSGLTAAGASGTIYSLVMPESEQALGAVVGEPDFLDRYREPWTQKQDSMHEEYFDEWLRWSAPAVAIRSEEFPFRYPTAGASEAIFKLIAEFASERRASALGAAVHMFEGEYEGFAAYADALKLPIVRHDRAAWSEVPARLGEDAMFWISQPSAIDGNVWPHFEAFVSAVAERGSGAQIVPDLTYVGSVAREYRIMLDSPAIPAVVISHSKPFGGYYHRVGGILARREHPSLFGNKWFKNLLSLAWGTEMMRRHSVFDLPRKYRPVQEEAVRRVAALLGADGLAAADVLLLATAPARAELPNLLASVLRGSPAERVVRLCLTPAMTCLIDPAMAPATAPRLEAAWG